MSAAYGCTQLLTSILDTPEYVRVRLVRPANAATTGHLVPVLDEFFRHACARTLIQFGRDMRFLKSPFHMYFCVESYRTNSFPNRAIAALMNGVQPSPRPWPGTVLVLKMDNHARFDYVDFTDDDIPDLLEFFMHWH